MKPQTSRVTPGEKTTDPEVIETSLLDKVIAATETPGTALARPKSEFLQAVERAQPRAVASAVGDRLWITRVEIVPTVSTKGNPAIRVDYYHGRELAISETLPAFKSPRVAEIYLRRAEAWVRATDLRPASAIPPLSDLFYAGKFESLVRTTTPPGPYLRTVDPATGFWRMTPQRQPKPRPATRRRVLCSVCGDPSCPCSRDEV